MLCLNVMCILSGIKTKRKKKREIHRCLLPRYIKSKDRITIDFLFITIISYYSMRNNIANELNENK